MPTVFTLSDHFTRRPLTRTTSCREQDGQTKLITIKYDASIRYKYGRPVLILCTTGLMPDEDSLELLTKMLKDGCYFSLTKINDQQFKFCFIHPSLVFLESCPLQEGLKKMEQLGVGDATFIANQLKIASGITPSQVLSISNSAAA